MLDVTQYVKALKMKVGKKTDKLREAVGTRGGKYDMLEFPEPLPMPLDPNVICRGIIPKKCKVFSSNT